MADQLATTAQCKVRLFPAGVTDSVDDALISELIDEVSAWIQSYTGRKFVAVSSTAYTFDTQRGYVLRVPIGIRSISSMGVASTHQPETGGTYVTVPATDYLLRPRVQDGPDGWPYTEVHIALGAVGTVRNFATAENGCTITGTWGFAAIPKDIEAVCIDAVVAAYQSRKNGASSQMGYEGTGVTAWGSFFGANSPQRGTLDRYRFPAMG